jgi:hypothetical protein
MREGERLDSTGNPPPGNEEGNVYLKFQGSEVKEGICAE